MIFGVFVLFQAYGENLTTLDGRRFTNVVFVTNYPALVIIKHDGGESGIKNTNLPAEFCAKHGIKISTYTVAASSRQTNAVDLFLASRSYPGFFVYSETNELIGNIDRTWTISVYPQKFEFSYSIMPLGNPGNFETHYLSFSLDQEYLAIALFNKVIQWGKNCVENNDESFEDYIGYLPYKNGGASKELDEIENSKFYWDKDHATAGLKVLQLGQYSNFDQKSIAHFLILIQSLPSLKQELANKIKNYEAKQALSK